ncbi:MAG: hypothetical protein ACI9MC_001744 [Kiritimatiellia bacterium]|jgi:hypothetical protein
MRTLLPLVVALISLSPRSAQASECEDPMAVLSRAKDKLFEMDFARFEIDLNAAVEHMGCHEPAQKEAISQLMFLHVLRAGLDPEKQGLNVDPYLASARAAQSSHWDAALGEVNRTKWSRDEVRDQGTLEIMGVPNGWTVLVDGTEQSGTSVRLGPHVVQMLDDAMHPRWASYVVVDGSKPVRGTPPSSVIPEELRQSFVKEYGDGGIVIRKGPKRLGFKVGGVAAGVLGVAAIASTWAVATQTPKGSSGTGALMAVNAGGWALAGGGLGLTLYGVLPQRTSGRGASFGLRGRF